MTHEERLIARILFVNRILRASGTAFQALFWAVMKAKHADAFVPVQPQGRLGDGGNDGYLPDDGHYFQIYGPIDPVQKVEHAATKLKDAFASLKAKWNHFSKIKKYSFVFNDKYEAAFTEIVQSLGELEKTNTKVKCRPFLASELEQEFMSLTPDQMQGILGSCIPNPTQFWRVDYSILKEVIDHIMNSPSSVSSTRFGDLPSLEEKISLNHLCSTWAETLLKGARQSGHVTRYFERNTPFAKQNLKGKLVEVYQRARDEGRRLSTIPTGITREDLVFADFREQLLPNNATVASEAAVDILIAYYFEVCDVFDPKVAKDQPNASP